MTDLNQSPQEMPGAVRLRLVLGMHRDGVAMMKQTLLRRYPHDTPEQRGQRLRDWLDYTPEMDDPRYEVRDARAH